MHLLLSGKDSGGGVDAGNLLKPALARGKLRCIGATTLEEYRSASRPIVVATLTLLRVH